MKIRKDFVTNSSSSSFILTINIETKDKTLQFYANGGSPECGRIDYFDNDAIITVSPKQLGTAKDVEEFIKLLTDGVVDGADWYETPPVKIFESSNPVKVEDYDFDDEDFDFDNPTMKEVNAYEFIEEIRANIKSMDDIIRIIISGEEDNYMMYYQTYTYDRKENKYTALIQGCEFEKDGASGGEINLSDLKECEIIHEHEDGWYR